MRTHESDAALAASNPVTRQALAGLDLAEADRELLAEILSEPLGADERLVTAVGAPVEAGSRRVHGRGILALSTGTAALAALILLVLGTTGGPSDQPSSAYGAELVNFAEASPLVLLQSPGWHVQYANEGSDGEGDVEFVNGPPIAPESTVELPSGKVTGAYPAAVRRRLAELSWRGGSLTASREALTGSATFTTTAPVLGTTAQVFEYEGGGAGNRDMVALWSEDGRVLEFSAAAPDVGAFAERLAALAPVDTDAWLEALPASVVKAADRAATVDEMLKGIPLPAGFDAASIPDAGLDNDRYQLGAAVAGTVACSWFAQWGEDRVSGDSQGAQEATAAMATAEQWPVLRAMSAEGAYTRVVLELAAAMPSGRWEGGSLLAEAGSALGCSDRGVELSTPPRSSAAGAEGE